MSKDELINNTLNNLKKLPKEKVQEIADFSDYLLKAIEDKAINKGISSLSHKSKAYDFLDEEEDLYSVHDIKEKYK